MYASGTKKKSQGKLENTLDEKNENTAYQNLQNAADAVPRGKFLAINACI